MSITVDVRYTFQAPVMFIDIVHHYESTLYSFRGPTWHVCCPDPAGIQKTPGGHRVTIGPHKTDMRFLALASFSVQHRDVRLIGHHVPAGRANDVLPQRVIYRRPAPAGPVHPVAYGIFRQDDPALPKLLHLPVDRHVPEAFFGFHMRF